MAQEPRPSPAWPGPKRQQGTAVFCSRNYNLDYELNREDVPYRVNEHQRIPPLINQVPAKVRRTYMGLGVKSCCSPCRTSRNRYLPPEQIKLGTEELHSIREELSQIKAQVDRLLESLERMDQQRDQAAGTNNSEENRGLGSEGSSCRTTEAPQEPKGQKALAEADSSEGCADAEQAVKNQASDQEGSQ